MHEWQSEPVRELIHQALDQKPEIGENPDF